MIRKTAKLISNILCSIIFNVRFENTENIPEKGAFILCSNHTSEWDMFIIGMRNKRWIYWMSKEELFRNKVVAFIFNKLGAFPVKRGKGDVESLKRAFEILSMGHALGVFPQGTRIRDGNYKNMSIKRGAAYLAQKTGTPVLPVAIKGKTKLFGKITVIYGKPFNLKMTSEDERELIKKNSIVIMDRIMELLEGIK